MSYPGHSGGGGVSLSLQRYGQCILQPQLTGQVGFCVLQVLKLMLSLEIVRKKKKKKKKKGRGDIVGTF